MVMLRGTGRGGPQSLPGLERLQGRLPGRPTGPDHGRGLAQVQFVNRYKIPLSTLRNWEQGACEPDRAAKVLLAAIATDPGDIQQADKSIRVRNAGEKLLPRPRFSSIDLTRRAEPPLVCRWNSRTACGLLAWLAGGSRKRLLAMRSARSF